MLRKISVSILLLLIGLLGSALPLFFHRDGTSLIVIGFGASVLVLHNRIQEGLVGPESFGPIRVLATIAVLAGIASMGYNVYMFNTTFNKVLLVGFAILQLWQLLTVFSAMSSKSKK